MSDLPTLRARVEAAQALAEQATPGPWAFAGSTERQAGLLVVSTAENQCSSADHVLTDYVRPYIADAHLMAAAPDLVTLAADLLAALEAAQTERDEARAELTAIRTALGNGADEAAWRPGETVAQAVERLRGEHRKLRDVLQWVNDQCPGKCAGVCDSALRVGHEGPHAEALADDGDTRG